MSLAPQVSNDAVIVLKPLCALNTVVLSQARQIKDIFGCLVLRQMLRILHIRLDLIQITEMSPRFRARLLVLDTHYCSYFVIGVKFVVIGLLEADKRYRRYR